MTKLTIGIVYFNEEELLTECLRSLLRQLDGADEIVIYDNGSQFPASDFLIQSERIRVIRSEENRGPAYARNQILNIAAGEFIHFHDSDDWFYPDWAAKVRQRIGDSGTDVVFTEVDSFVDGTRVGEKIVGLSRLSENSDLVRFCIRHFMLVPCGTYRVERLRALGGYRESLWQSEDYDFHLRLALSNPKAVFIESALIAIRLRKESRSQNRAETVRDAVKTLELAASQLGVQYRSDLAERLSQFGTQLFALSHFGEARRVMTLARSFGRPQFEGRRPFFRMIATCLGQYAAEGIAAKLRGLVQANATVSKGSHSSTIPAERTQP